MTEVKTGGVLRIMDPGAGDTRMHWDPDNSVERNCAEEQFNTLKKKGFQAFRMDRKGRKSGEPISSFDPAAKEIIMCAPISGG